VMTRAGIPPDGAADALRLHAGITGQYLEALKLFEPDKPETMRLVDERIRGKDRQLEDKIDLIVNTLQLYADSESARLVDLSVSGSQRAIRILAVVVLLIIAGAVALGLLIIRNLYRQLGGEPGYAVEVASRIAAGDLASEVRVGKGGRASLLWAIQKMQADLRALVADVVEGARGVATTSEQIARGNLDLSQRTEEQAGTLQETASSMEELTATVGLNAENARKAAQFATGASAVAARGGEAVGQVVSTMNGISESSRRISDIVSVIDGIAFQTNILALNAAVEAARAGEQGRGFAVVAAEVRNLAQRSAAAAKEIKVLIGASVDKVEAGTRLVDAAGRTMQEIVGSVKVVSDLIADIAAASQEQNSGLGQVNIAVAQMDHVVQQNATLVEEANGATESMRSQAEALVRLVSRFRLGSAPGASAAAASPEAQAAFAALAAQGPARLAALGRA
jgi:methyl-accepting chemotaxis protein